MDIRYMRAKYALTPDVEITNDPLLDGRLDKEQVEVTYPVDPLTNTRQAIVVRALSHRTSPALRNTLMSQIEILPNDRELDKHLTDDDKLAFMRPRLCQTRSEMASYNEYLKSSIDDALKDVKAKPDPVPAPSSDPVPDPASDPVPKSE